MDQKKTYFVFRKELGLPIYIKCFLGNFRENFVEFLNSMGFEKITGEPSPENLEGGGAHILEMKRANSVVASRIRSSLESDTYGPESIVPRDGHRVYRYKGVALLLYSAGPREWVAGCFEDFGTGPDGLAYRSIIGRYLSWALAPRGIVGFWGKFSSPGLEVMRQGESRGEIVFVDIRENRVVTGEGVKPLGPEHRILRRDKSVGKEKIRMSREELASFLIAYTSYMDYPGPIMPLRQAVLAISSRMEGVVCGHQVPGVEMEEISPPSVW